MNTSRSKQLFCLLALAILSAGCGRRSADAVVLATTTSVEDSGLLAHLLQAYRKDAPDAIIRPLAVGSGEALELGRRGDADLLIAHYPSEEEAFVEDGHGEGRVPIMFNDFVMVGPAADPADIGSARTAVEALRAIASAQAPFLSRGDDSGTHGRELQLWEAAGITPAGSWYLQAGQGMGPLLQMASERSAYALSDRATFYAMESILDLALLFEGDPQLRNVYSVILVRDSRAERQARVLWDWLTSAKGQGAIEAYRDSFGRALFHPLRPGAPALEASSRPAEADMRMRGASAGRLAGPGVDRSGLAGSGMDGSVDGPGASLRRRFLCHSVPPALADSRC